MKPGRYESMPFAEYAAIDAMNHTRLGWLMDESPLYYRSRSESMFDADSVAMKLGRAEHCATLEPDSFDGLYALEPDPSQFIRPERKVKGIVIPAGPYASPRSCGPYKDAVASLQAQGRTVLKRDEFDLSLSIARAIREHPRTGALLRSAKGIETVLVWERDGLLCKARLDFWGEGWLADLKATVDFGGFSPWVITKYRIYRQMAWYRSGAIANGMFPEVCYLPTVSNVVPEVALFALTKDALDAGDLEIAAGWDLYRSCLDSGEWPGRYPDEVLDGNISDRRFSELFAEGE